MIKNIGRFAASLLSSSNPEKSCQTFVKQQKFFKITKAPLAVQKITKGARTHKAWVMMKSIKTLGKSIVPLCKYATPQIEKLARKPFSCYCRAVRLLSFFMLFEKCLTCKKQKPKFWINASVKVLRAVGKDMIEYPPSQKVQSIGFGCLALSSTISCIHRFVTNGKQ